MKPLLCFLVASRVVALAAQGLTASFHANGTSRCTSDYQEKDENGDCTCRDGFSGLDCRMCTVNAEQDATDVCASALGSGYQCVTRFVYDSSSLGKAYTCTLSKDLQALIPDGVIALNCDRNTHGKGSCQAAVYKAKETLNGDHLLDCNLTQCTFPTGSTNVNCSAIACQCGAECAAMTKSIVDSLSGQPAQIQVDEATDQVTLAIEGSPLPLAATCKVAACQLPGTTDGTPSTTTSSDASSDATGKGVALVACLVLATILCMGFFSFCCCLDGSRHEPSKETLETELLKVATRSVQKLEFRHITCYGPVDKKKALEPPVLLHAISGRVVRGQVLGLLGPSGSGKTTLLNALAAMQNGHSTFTGALLLDGHAVPANYRRLAAYVQQDDTLFATLTVRECLTYSAHLRLPLAMTALAKNAMVDRVLMELNLSHLGNARIGVVGGSTTDRGISGGERRRVSIGMELVTSPSILILDEPTSGLDSSSAYAVVKVIQDLARHDRIVILSIHQPSARAFALLDQILVLAHGHLVYSGSPADAKRHFVDLGYSCPANDNVADFLLDVASDPDRPPPGPVSHDPDKATPPPRAPYSPSTPLGSPSLDAPFITDGLADPRSVVTALHATMRQLRVLFTRTALNICRHRSLLVQHVVLSLVLGLVGGLIFHNVTDNLAGFQNRMGAFFFILTFFGFASLSSMDLFIAERPIFLRETGAKYYNAWSYFVAKMTLDTLLLRVVPASVFACIFYWLMALQAAAARFLLFWVTLVLFNVAAGSISVLVGVLSTRVGSANLAATVVLLVMLLFGGFLLNAETMPASVAWLQHLSIFNYAFEILMVNELEGIVLSFDAPGYPAVPVYGEVYLRTLNMEATERYYDVAALAVGAIGLQVLAFIALAFQVPSHRAIENYGKKAA